MALSTYGSTGAFGHSIAEILEILLQLLKDKSQRK
jgi:hypothetical protein